MARGAVGGKALKWPRDHAAARRSNRSVDRRPRSVIGSGSLRFRDAESHMSESRPPLPPFDFESATLKARKAEDAWNTHDPERVSLAYTEDSTWRNRAEFFTGRPAIVEFLTRKWARELDYRLIKELWAFHDNRIAVRFQYEWRDDSGSWWRSYGNEQWEFDERGLMRRREASINDVSIREADRKFLWPKGPRPEDYPGLTELGL